LGNFWSNSTNLINFILKNGEHIVKICELLEFGALQKLVNRVDLKKMLYNESLLANIGFDTTENEPSNFIF